MTRARFYYRFRVPDLLVEQTVVESTFEGLADGRRVSERMPADLRIFDRDHDVPPADAPIAPTGSESGSTRSVGTIQVSVDGVVGVGATEMNLVDDYRPAIQMIDEMSATLIVAKRIVSGLIDWARTDLSQFALGLQGEPPRLDDWQRILDLDGGRFYPFATTEPGWASFRPFNARPASVEFLERIVGGGYGEPAPSAYLLLADARHLALRGAWPRSVLLAAMATEMRVKKTLRAVADERQRDLVEVLLTSPRDFSQPVAGLFDKAMSAVAGRSLRRDDLKTYRSVGELFETRNSLVHRGAQPTELQGRRGIEAALGGFAWLERLETPIRELSAPQGSTTLAPSE